MKKSSRIRNLFNLAILPFNLFFKGLFWVARNLKTIIGLPFKLMGYLWENFMGLFKFSIAFKFSFYYSLMFAVLLLLTSFAIVFGFKMYVTAEESRNLKDLSVFLQTQVMQGEAIPTKQFETAEAMENLKVRLTDANGTILYGAKPSQPNFFPVFSEPEDSDPDDSDPDGSFFSMGTLQIREDFPSETPLYSLLLQKDLTLQNEYLAILFGILALFNLTGIVVISITGSRLSRRMLQPIRTMTEAVKRITVTDLDTKLDTKGTKDELKDLALTFNDMTRRIKEAYERQNQFVSDASHELRTPISVVQGYADMLERWGKNDPEVLDESISAIRDEARSMKDLTEKLLYLARTDKTLIKSDKTEFDMEELMDEIARETRMIDTSHDIRCESEKPLPILASRKSIKQALRIFIDNSRKFTPEGGIITLRAYNKKNKIILEIEDTGIGIPKKDIPLIFNRFYRVDKSRSKKMGGSGLGLSIAKWIVEEHEGRILVKSKEGEGTRMSMVLPYK